MTVLQEWRIFFLIPFQSSPRLHHHPSLGQNRTWQNTVDRLYPLGMRLLSQGWQEFKGHHLPVVCHTTGCDPNPPNLSLYPTELTNPCVVHPIRAGHSTGGSLNTPCEPTLHFKSLLVISFTPVFNHLLNKVLYCYHFTLTFSAGPLCSHVLQAFLITQVWYKHCRNYVVALAISHRIQVLFQGFWDVI